MSIKIDVPDTPDRAVNNTEDWTEADNDDWEECGMLMMIHQIQWNTIPAQGSAIFYPIALYNVTLTMTDANLDLDLLKSEYIYPQYF